jgi:alanine racemase
MKLNIPLKKFAEVIGAENTNLPDVTINSVAFDTRKVIHPDSDVFFAMLGNFRDGHDFIEDAISKGIQYFVVRKGYVHPNSNAYFLEVDNPLKSLQKLAAHHREKYNYPVLAITGSVGKTIVKEWIYHLISGEKNVVRSPKSYNSQLGVALSILEMSNQHQVALIEAGISRPDEMQSLLDMIQPTYGIFTAIGSAHAENFDSLEHKIEEKAKLFTGAESTWFNPNIPLSDKQMTDMNAFAVAPEDYKVILKHAPFQDKASLENLSLSVAFALHLGIEKEVLLERIKTLPRLALRMETFDGINNNLIINDSYNLDLEALTQSLEYQLSLANGRKRVAIIVADQITPVRRLELNQILAQFDLNAIYQISKDETLPLEEITDSVVLIKGSRSAQAQKVASLFQLKKHKTLVEINFSAIKENLSYYRNLIESSTKILIMVKAASYGSGAVKMSEYLQKVGVDYLGVAYADEGVELRNNGITLPILVMNAQEDGFNDIINHQLEPAIYSFDMLDSFVKHLIMHNLENYPVHLKIDTGMRRLGFEPEAIHQVIDILQAQPEIKLKGVYSHLADADNPVDENFTLKQIERFQEATNILSERLSYKFIKHILNTEGTARYTNAQMDMVRIGIGIYGYSSNPKVQSSLIPAIGWKSVISQIKKIKQGETVGYSRTFIAPRDMSIAVVPVGYADGFKRSLGNGEGGFYVQEKWCPIIGNVCMDMTMIDVTDVITFEGDSVEIIGKNQSLSSLSDKMKTIPYEVLTSISRRVHRVYLEE